MKTTAFILLGLLAAWWLLVAVFLTFFHQKRVRETRIPLTAEEREDCRELDARLRFQMRPIHWVIISPIVLVMLPLYLYGWLVTDVYDEQWKA
jgi:hypothetical protein